MHSKNPMKMEDLKMLPLGLNAFMTDWGEVEICHVV